MGNEYLDPGTHNVPLSQLYADVGATVIGTASGLFFLCLLAVIARFAASRKGKIALWWDDWLCIPSLVLILSFFVLPPKRKHHLPILTLLRFLH